MDKKLIFLLVFCISFEKTIGQDQSFIESQVESLIQHFDIEVKDSRIYSLLKFAGSGITGVVVSVINYALESLTGDEYPGLSYDCRQNLVDLAKSLFLGPEGWGWKVIDSIGKPPSGIMKANWIWTGDYYQCINMKINQTQITTTKPLTGRYCYAKLMMPIDKKTMKLLVDQKMVFGLGLGTCFPTSCSPQDIQLLFDHTLGSNVKILIDEDFCSTSDGPQMDTVAILLTILVSIPIFLVVTTTVFEYFQQKFKNNQISAKTNSYIKTVAVSADQRGLWQSLCFIFSGKNSYTALAPSPTLISGNNAITCLYGIRISTMVLAIWIHVYTLRFLEFPWKNMLDYLSIMDYPRMHYAGQSFPIMQVFFLMSGFCLVLSTYGPARKNIESFSIVKSYIFRYARMMPLYLYTAAFNAGPYFYLVSGPIWASAKTLQIACRNNWIRRLLNFENYFHLYKFDNDCVTGEYFFGVDWQLFLIAIPVIWLLLRKPNGALAIIITAILSVTVTLAVMLIFIENFHLFYYLPKRNKQHPVPGRSDHPMVLQVYTGFWSRIPGFGMGMLAGYFLVCYGNKANFISKRMYFYGWTLFWVSNIMYELYGQFFFQAAYIPTFWAVVYAFFTNLMFPATWCFLIIHCVQFPLSFANKFLSLKLFQVLGKITFPMYTVQISVLFWYYSCVVEPGYLDYYTKIKDFVIITTVCIIASFILHFVVESPLDRFLKLIKGKSPRNVKKSGD